MLKVEELEKQVNSGVAEGIYLFYGAETFLLEQQVKKMKKVFGELVKGINYIIIDENSIQELIADIETPAFGYPKKLIIAKNTGIFKREGKGKIGGASKELKDRINEYLKDNIEMIKESVLLIFIEDEAEKNSIFNTIEKIGTICEFEEQKPQQIIKRLKAICNAYKVNIDEATTRYFIECCGTNMQELINEIRKLIEYAGENGTITSREINLLSTKQIQAIIFDLTDSLGKKDIAQSLKVLKGLIASKEPIQKILITLYNHFKKLYIVKIAERSNKNLITAMNLKPNQTFLTTKYKQQAKYFEEIELNKILKELSNLDSNYKNGLIDLQIGLESILCRYCSK